MMKWLPTALVLTALYAVGADARAARGPNDAPVRITGRGSAQIIADGDKALRVDRAQAIAVGQFVRLSAGGDGIRVRLARFDGDVVARSGVRWTFIPEGVSAPGHDSTAPLHPSEAGHRMKGGVLPLTLVDETARPVIGAPVRTTAAPRLPRDPRPAIALTFDDIPAHGPLPVGTTRLAVIRDIVRALTEAKVPTFGFLNAGFGTDDPAGSANVVAAWRAAGLALGNHTYSHANLDLVGAPAFATEIARNEGPLAAVAREADWHWFRYPFLAEGGAPAVREAARAAKMRRGYRIAAVTMSFDDYKWNPPYARCDVVRDDAAIAALANTFLADARTAALASRARAKAQVGRDIPYVLLLHVGAFDARMLPRLLGLYRAMGFRFVTLAEAETDPYYGAAVDLAQPGPSPSLAGPPPMPALAGPPAHPCG